MECRNGIDVLDCRKIEDVKIFAGIDIHRNRVFVDAKDITIRIKKVIPCGLK